MDLTNIGNLDNYKHEPRCVVPCGLIEHSNLILKFYAMFKEALTQPNVDEAKKCLEDRIGLGVVLGKIDPLSGLGFAILSEDMLNVARWDTNPIVLKNQIYSYEQDESSGKYLGNAKLLDIRYVGSFCIWELGIVDYERGAWMKYLKSERNEEDKNDYLGNMMCRVKVLK